MRNHLRTFTLLAALTALAALALSLLHADVFCFIESLSRGSVSSLLFT